MANCSSALSTVHSPSKHAMLPKRNDLVRSVNALITQRSSTIRALYIVSIAAPGARDDVNAEFHQAVGDVLEGVQLSQLKLVFIDRSKVKEEIAWLRERTE